MSPEIALKFASVADCWCTRRCKANPVDLEGSRGQVLVVLDGFGKVWGDGGENPPRLLASKRVDLITNLIN